MENTVRKVVNYAVQVASPVEVYLFGSMASGSYNASSDLDLIIVVEKNACKKQICELVKNYARELSLKSDILVYTTEELREAIVIPHSFVATVIKNCKNVYKKE